MPHCDIAPGRWNRLRLRNKLRSLGRRGLDRRDRVGDEYGLMRMPMGYEDACSFTGQYICPVVFPEFTLLDKFANRDSPGTSFSTILNEIPH